MKKYLILVTLSLSTLVAGCSMPLVTSTLLSPKSIDEANSGVIYSLPMQLVKIKYTREPINPDKALKTIKSVTERITLTKEEIRKRKVKKTLLEEKAEIAATDNQQKKYKKEIKKLGEEIITYENLLKKWKKQLVSAQTEHALVQKSDNSFKEKLEIIPQSPIPDKKHTYYAKVDHAITGSETIEINTKNGMLDGMVMGFHEDKSGEIITSLGEALGGLISPASSLKLFSKSKHVPDSTCTKTRIMKVEQVIDPYDKTEINSINKKLKNACITIVNADPKPANNKQSSHKGLIYRQPGIITFEIARFLNLNDTLDCTYNQKACKKLIVQKVRLPLAQAGHIGIINFPTGFTTKNEYDIQFSNGMLVKRKITQNSALLGLIQIIPNTLRAIVKIPAELIQFKVDYSSKEKSLAETNLAILKAQTEILKAGKALEQEKLNQEDSNINQ